MNRFMKRQNYNKSANKKSHIKLLTQGKPVVILGEAGVGKTTFLYSYKMECLNKGYKVVFIEHYCNSLNEFKKKVIQQLSPNEKITEEQIDNIFLRQLLYNSDAVFLIDNCHKYDEEMLKNIYLSLTINSLVPIYFSGRNELEEIIKRANIETEFLNIKPLTINGVEEYVWFRLVSIGGYSSNKPNPFRNCIKEIFESTRGIPKKINILCEQLLIDTANKREREVSKETLEEVLSRLSL